NNSHYITSPFNISTVTVYKSATQRFGLQSNIKGTSLIRDSQSPSNSRRILVNNSKIIMFGVSMPSAFNANGTLLATRTIDYAINQSISAITD
ncbi:MAG: hypothetical protein AB1529_02485, partial [Candidatus Micrarchaeota archaeon]